MKIHFKYVPTEYRAVGIRQSIRQDYKPVSSKIILVWKKYV